MRRYRTEIVIPTDRYVAVQLPAELPEGRAIITVEVEEPAADELGGNDVEFDPHSDIEWWEEFGGDEADLDEPWGLSVRLGALES